MAKAYSAASTLHAMALLQIYQAKVLKDMQEGSADPRLMQELCVTKVTARSPGADDVHATGPGAPPMAKPG